MSSVLRVSVVRQFQQLAYRWSGYSSDAVAGDLVMRPEQRGLAAPFGVITLSRPATDTRAPTSWA